MDIEAQNSKHQEEDQENLDRPWKRDSLDSLNSNTPPQSLSLDVADKKSTSQFTREHIFAAVSCGDSSQLQGLQEFLTANNKRLSSPEFRDDSFGKTALLKALMNLKDGRNDTISMLLDIAERTGDLKRLINASYTDWAHKGLTALHVAIERRSLDNVKLLVQKGANVLAKASGKFFHLSEPFGFYFGELPLSLAACTNQPDIVSYLLDSPKSEVIVWEKDSEGNTVLHALVMIADNSPEDTLLIAQMYDKILLHSGLRLEDMKNNQGLTPLKLAAKLGKIGLLKHILHREFFDKESASLSRKFTGWVLGPVHSSFYDTTSIDTDDDNSVLEIIVFGSKIPNRTEMLQLEPLHSLLKDKWDRFASKLFFLSFLSYMIYLSIFTAVTVNRKEGKPPFPIEDVPDDSLRITGEVISVLGAVWFFYKSVVNFKRNPPTFTCLYTDGLSYVLFFTQATLLLLCIPLYACGLSEYVGLQVISLALAWINVLYYTKGTKQLGIYSVMMQRMILRDILHFLCVYAVFLFGFSAALMSLIKDTSPGSNNRTKTEIVDFYDLCKKPSHHDFGFTMLELFKFTIGMGDLQFTDCVQYKEVFYILLILYIVLTYILMLNMLIAVMGNTVERISNDSEHSWNLQRSRITLDLENSLPHWIKDKLYSMQSKITIKRKGTRRLLQVEEVNWTKWRSDLYVCQQEGPRRDSLTDEPQPKKPAWSFTPFIERIRHRRSEIHVVDSSVRYAPAPMELAFDARAPSIEDVSIVLPDVTDELAFSSAAPLRNFS